MCAAPSPADGALDASFAGVSFDLFGTLVTVEAPADPADAIAAELAARGVDVPADWADAYAEPHVSVPDGAELSLPEHVSAALASRVDADDDLPERSTVDRAVSAAFDTPVETRDGATEAVAAAAAHGPVGLLSNCSVPGLVHRTLRETALDPNAFDAVVASVDCGWRKPDPRAFEAVATELGIDSADLLHVGDDETTDGRTDRVGATSLLLDDVSLSDLAAALEGDRWA